MGNIIAIFPGDRGADFHRELFRLEGEIVDHDRRLLGTSDAEVQGRYCRSDGQSKAKAAEIH
jgi:hypothetical protein